MVGYTILDLRRMGLTPRCHIRLLENSVVDVLAGYGVRGVITGDPGVWVPRSSVSTATAGGENNAHAEEGAGAGVGAGRKITAVGVHLRRNISSYGIGLNVSAEPMWWFRQIVACGLEGREATSLEGEGVGGVRVDDVARTWVSAFVGRYNAGFACGGGNGSSAQAHGERIEGVYEVGEGDLI